MNTLQINPELKRQFSETFQNLNERDMPPDSEENRKILSVYELIEKRNKKLYFSHLGGLDTISCFDCGYKEDVVSFLHGLKRADCDKDCEDEDCDEESDECFEGAAIGYQCQSCGKFHELNEIENKVKPLICPCGGELSRDKHLFCPKCKSTNMKYNCRIIT